MTDKIGVLIAQSFREIMKKYNPKMEYYKINDEEKNKIEQILRKIDNKEFDLISELEKFLDINE